MADAQTSPSSRIFVSYRREDSAGHVLALIPRLRAHFGADRIFKDTDSIAPGQDFVNTIKEELESCSVLLAIMGRDWLTVADPRLKIRRLDNPEDFLRLEVATALKQPNILVIPVLVGRANMPNADDLPPDLTSLARRNAIELSDTRWDSDVDRLIRAIEQVCAAPATSSATQTPVTPTAPPRPARKASQSQSREFLQARRKRQIAQYLSQARAAFEVGDYEAVIQACDEALYLDPNDPEGLALSGQAREALDQREIGGLLDSAREHLAKGAMGAASELIDKALLLDPGSQPALDARLDLLNARAKAERGRERARLLKAALARTQASFDEEDFEATIQNAEDALAIDETSVDAADFRARAQHAIEERRKARDLKRRAQKAVSDARTEFASGHPEKAFAMLDEFAPEHELVRQTLLDLRKEWETSRAKQLIHESKKLIAAASYDEAIELLDSFGEPNNLIADQLLWAREHKESHLQRDAEAINRAEREREEQERTEKARAEELRHAAEEERIHEARLEKERKERERIEGEEAAGLVAETKRTEAAAREKAKRAEAAKSAEAASAAEATKAAEATRVAQAAKAEAAKMPQAATVAAIANAVPAGKQVEPPKPRLEYEAQKHAEGGNKARLISVALVAGIVVTVALFMIPRSRSDEQPAPAVSNATEAQNEALPSAAPSRVNPAPPGVVNTDTARSKSTPEADLSVAHLERLRQRATQQYEGGQLAEALATATEAIRLRPRDATFSNLLDRMLSDARDRARQARDTADRSGAKVDAQREYGIAMQSQDSASGHVRSGRQPQAIRAFLQAAQQFSAAGANARRVADARALQQQQQLRDSLARENAKRKTAAEAPTEMPTPEVSDEDRIRETLRDFKASYERLDVDAVKHAWPSVDAVTLRNTFAGYAGFSMDLKCRGITVNGSTARVTCEVVRTIRPRSGQTQTFRQTEIWSLKKQGSGWVITSLR